MRPENRVRRADAPRVRRGRRAGRTLIACVVAFDLVFLVGVVAEPMWWRFAVLVALVGLQALLAIAPPLCTTGPSSTRGDERQQA